MVDNHTNLRANHLDRLLHSKTCGYWYTVTSGAQAHTAFRTRRGLDLWLGERGLSLTNDIGECGDSCLIAGGYREVRHMIPRADFERIKGAQVFVMSNGSYTEGIISWDGDGLRTVHTMNINRKDRRRYYYKQVETVRGQQWGEEDVLPFEMKEGES